MKYDDLKTRVDQFCNSYLSFARQAPVSDCFIDLESKRQAIVIDALKVMAASGTLWHIKWAQQLLRMFE